MPRENLLELFVEVAAAQHAVDQVGPIEGSNEDRRIHEPQLGDDVTPDAFGRRGRERMERDVQLVTQPSELPVLGTEVVSPLTDAVGLVDRDEAHAPLLERTPEALTALADQAFRGDVEQTAAIFAQAGDHAVAFVSGLRAVQVGGRHTVDPQAVHLIFHQRDQRRYDQREPLAILRTLFVQQQRRRLETQRLAAAGRQHEQAVAAIDDRVHGFLLEWPESRKAPDAVERIKQQGIVQGAILYRDVQALRG